MKKITVDELVTLIQELKSGNKNQAKPAIVWFDKVEGDILRYDADHGDWVGLANALAKNDNEIAVNPESGSPFTDHKKLYDEEKNIVRDITKEERYSFVLPPVIKFDDEGKLTTKCYIHYSWEPYIGDDGLTTLEYSKMIHEKMKLPVFLFFPIGFKEKINGDFSEYEEFLCTDDPENIKERWFRRVSEKDEDNIQIIDNFFLDFLKTAPNELLSYDFIEEPHWCINPSYKGWERMNERMLEGVEEICELVDPDFNPLHLFTDGNLDFDKLATFLDSIPKDKWEDWVKANKLHLEHIDNLTTENDRIKIFKVFIGTDFGGFPSSCSEALLEFHGIK